MLGAFLGLGVASGVVDVLVNADAAAYEMEFDKPFMNFAHASFQTLIASGAGPKTRPDESKPANPARKWGAPRFQQRLPLLCAICGIAFTIEGSQQDWSAIHLEDTRHSTRGSGTVGPMVFALAMLVSRLTGQALELLRVSQRRILVGGLAITWGGTLLTALGPSSRSPSPGWHPQA